MTNETCLEETPVSVRRRIGSLADLRVADSRDGFGPRLPTQFGVMGAEDTLVIVDANGKLVAAVRRECPHKRQDLLVYGRIVGDEIVCKHGGFAWCSRSGAPVGHRVASAMALGSVEVVDGEVFTDLPSQ